MTDLLTLWLADKVTDMVSDEHIVASEALSMAGKSKIIPRVGSPRNAISRSAFCIWIENLCQPIQ